jgi:hypothetical protein
LKCPEFCRKFPLVSQEVRTSSHQIAPSTSTTSTQRGVAEADLLELVVFFHETDHPVVVEADLLELVVGEVVGLVMALGVPVEVVAAGLGELLALAVRPILHCPAEIDSVALDAAR